MTLVSRVFGFVRDMVIAGQFGAGLYADAFFVAFRIPNFFRRLFAEGSFSQGFVPVLAEYKSRRGPDEVRMLVDRVAGTLAGALFLVTVVCVLAAPLFVAVFAPGFLSQPEKYAVTTVMLRITFPYLLFISLAAFAGAILNTHGRFGIPAFTPVFLNVSLIVAALALAPHFTRPVVALAWGVFVGGLVQLVFQLPFLKQLGLLPRPVFAWHDAGVRRIMRLMGPALFGASVAQINLMFDTLLASFLQTGSVSWLYYADRLLEFPLGVFGIALATVILPSLSEQHADGDTAQFSQLLDWALRWVCVIAIPAALGLMLFAAPMLSTLFQYGRMSERDVLMSSYALTAYAPGLIAFTLVKVLAPAYYSRHDTRTPVRIGLIAMFGNMALNLIIIYPLSRLGVGHVGLALATCLSGFFNATMLYRGLRHTGVYQPAAGWAELGRRLLVANGVMAVVLWVGRGELDRWSSWSPWLRAANLGGWIAVAGVIYVMVLWRLGWRLRDMTAARPPV